MGTTVWISENTRDRLRERKRRTGASSVDEVIRSLLVETEPTTADVFARRRKQVRVACREHRIARLVAFGSRARRDARPGSDIDLAYELAADRLATFDLFDHVAIQEALTDAFGVRVDVIRLGAARGRIAERIRQDGVDLVASA